METIFIPRLSILTKHKCVFTNLNKFSSLTGFVPTESAETVKHLPKQGNRVSNILRILRKSVIKPKNNHSYSLVDNEDNIQTIFSPELKTKYRDRKTFLLQMIERHEEAMLELGKAKMKCLKSSAKMEQYQLVLEKQRTSLQYKQRDKTVRIAALKVTRALFDKWTCKNDKDQCMFRKKLQEETKYREEIQSIAKEIEREMVDVLDNTIRELMEENKQVISVDDISRLSRQLYSKTCRMYKFSIVQDEPNRKELVHKPIYETSLLSETDMCKRIKTKKMVVKDDKKELVQTMR